MLSTFNDPIPAGAVWCFMGAAALAVLAVVEFVGARWRNR